MDSRQICSGPAAFVELLAHLANQLLFDPSWQVNFTGAIFEGATVTGNTQFKGSIVKDTGKNTSLPVERTIPELRSCCYEKQDNKSGKLKPTSVARCKSHLALLLLLGVGRPLFGALNSSIEAVVPFDEVAAGIGCQRQISYSRAAEGSF